jgi:Protein of unknown function (DUF3027)
VSSNPPMIQEFPAGAGAEPPVDADQLDQPARQLDQPAGPVEQVDPAEGVTDASAPPAEPAEPEPAEPDPVALAAVDLAREAAVEFAEPGTVGEHLGAAPEPGGLTVHTFGSTAHGYRGWHWAVSLAHVAGSDRVTVCDVVLLPGRESILAPAWVPWSDRLAPGDLGPGDELPYLVDDPLLVPGYAVTDEDDADQQMFWELGLGRERVVGPEGLLEAAQRWERGDHGPTSQTAIQAAAPCLSCGYFLPVSGLLRQHFGVCTNEWSPADGSVVAMDFGCGAHSQTDLELPAPEPLAAHILDETTIEPVVLDRSERVDDAPPVERNAEPVAERDAEPADETPGDAPAEPVAELVAEPADEAPGQVSDEVPPTP